MALTLRDIIKQCQDGEQPDVDDLVHAILALNSLSAFDTQDFMSLAHDESGVFNNPEFRLEEHWRRWKGAYDTPPKKWMGMEETR